MNGIIYQTGKRSNTRIVQNKVNSGRSGEIWNRVAQLAGKIREEGANQKGRDKQRCFGFITPRKKNQNKTNKTKQMYARKVTQ